MKTHAIIHIMNSLFETLVKNQCTDPIHDGGRRMPVFSRNEGIYFKVQVRSEFHGYEKDGNTHHPEWAGRCTKYFHVLMLYPHCVFTQVTDEYSMDIPQTGWYNTSNHNSCWRSGCDKLTYVMFDCYDEAHKNMPQELFHSRSDDTSVDLRRNICDGTFSFVEASWEYQEDDYHMTIKSVKEIKKTITC